jgi:hypothetical protein
VHVFFLELNGNESQNGCTHHRTCTTAHAHARTTAHAQHARRSVVLYLECEFGVGAPACKDEYRRELLFADRRVAGLHVLDEVLQVVELLVAQTNVEHLLNVVLAQLNAQPHHFLDNLAVIK